MLGGLLAGVTVSGVMMAIFQSNSGGAWDNAKKMFEEGVDIKGEKFYKGSEPHKAAVVGDTVGDPFKDTSGPSLNILLKLMSVVALVIAPSITKDGQIMKWIEGGDDDSKPTTELRYDVDGNEVPNLSFNDWMAADIAELEAEKAAELAVTPAVTVAPTNATVPTNGTTASKPVLW